MDSCVIPLRFQSLSLVQTTDFFYPLVDDPYIQVNQLQNSLYYFYLDVLCSLLKVLQVNYG